MNITIFIIFTCFVVLALHGMMDFFDALTPKSIDEDTFFPPDHEVMIRPSDKKALLARVMETGALYKIFYDFLFNKALDKSFIDTEIEYIIKMKANIVGEINGTTGSGKSQLSRNIAKRIARARNSNIRFIIDGELYEKSQGKKGSLFIILNKNYKDVMNCYITYSFFETTNMIVKLSKKDMVIQDEIEQSMGTDSMLIKKMITNILNINVRKNMVSVIFNTPSFIALKNLNFIIETFGIKNNGTSKLAKENMLTYALLYDKNCKPFAISNFGVWESEKEHEFYENMSQIRKDEFKKTGGGKRIVPDMEVVEKCAVVLVDYAKKRQVYKKDTLKTLARYIKEFSGIPSGMLNDIVTLAHEELEKELGDGEGKRKKKGKSIKEVKAEKEKENETNDFTSENGSELVAIQPSEEDPGGEIEGSAMDPEPGKSIANSSSAVVKTCGDANLKPVLDFVSDMIKKDFSDYHQKIWDYIVGAGMTYDMVAERMKKDGIDQSHMTVGRDFNKVRAGSKKNGEPIGMGYYVELWWAMKHNQNGYSYLPPKNDDKPDYIHPDGTVDSVKSVWETRRTYFVPEEDCFPEVDYCRKNKIPSFRLVFVNFKHTVDKFIIKIIDVSKASRQVIFTPSMFSDA